MSHSADPVLQNPFRYPSNAVANVDSEVSSEEIQPSLNLGNGGQGSSDVQLTRNGGESGLRARRVSRHESQPPRPSLLNLSIPTMPNIPLMGPRNTPAPPVPTPEETGLEGEHLFVNFIHEEVRGEGLSEPEEFSPGISTQTGGAESQGQASHFERQGQMLRQIADEFARSNERRRVHTQANMVDLANIQQRDFLQLLRGLFNDGADSRNVTFERIVVLFFFIRDLAVRAIRQKINSCFLSFMEWSVAFIRQHVCQWVQQNGGWEAVLEYVFTRRLLVKAGLVIVAVGATLTLVGAIIYWQKNT